MPETSSSSELEIEPRRDCLKKFYSKFINGGGKLVKRFLFVRKNTLTRYRQRWKARMVMMIS